MTKQSATSPFMKTAFVAIIMASTGISSTSHASDFLATMSTSGLESQLTFDQDQRLFQIMQLIKQLEHSNCQDPQPVTQGTPKPPLQDAMDRLDQDIKDREALLKKLNQERAEHQKKINEKEKKINDIKKRLEQLTKEQVEELKKLAEAEGKTLEQVVDEKYKVDLRLAQPEIQAIMDEKRELEIEAVPMDAAIKTQEDMLAHLKDIVKKAKDAFKKIEKEHKEKCDKQIKEATQ